MYVKFKASEIHRADRNQYNADRILRCMIHETITPNVPKEKQKGYNQYFLIETTKERSPYDGVKGGDNIQRYFVDPDFPGFWNEDGTHKRMFYEWVSGDLVEIIDLSSNSEAIHLLHSDHDYVNID
jgi:hypothetical protein